VSTEAARELRDWLVDFVADVLDIDKTEVDPGAQWESLGVDSANTLVLAADLSVLLGRDVRPVEILSNPTIDAVVAHLGAVELVGGRR
jgi:acyl carrier protein